MNEQAAATEQHPFQTMAAPDGASEPGLEPASRVTGGMEDSMIRSERADVAPAASLVGSLSVFSLGDILSVLAKTAQSGELQVVADSSGGRLWLDEGRLTNAQVGSATTIGQSVFELACLAEGWFYFTAGPTGSGQPGVSVDAVLSEVGPQVEEWREIRQIVPLDALVSLSPTPPGHDVQIRSDQWQVLTSVGSTGRSVSDVLEAIGGDQMSGLRTLRDLSSVGLIVLTSPSDRPVGGFGTPSFVTPPSSVLGMIDRTMTVPSPPTLAADTPVVPPPPLSEPVAVGDDERSDVLAEVTAMPPPIAGDPWAPITGAGDSKDDGAA
jgi:hypothetical protein